MQKFLTVTTLFMAILLLLGGLFYKDNVIMWLAATTEFYTVIRGGLIAVLLSLLLSKPPRSYAVRMFFGLLAVGISAASLGMTYMNTMNFLDTFVFLSASILFGLAALEPTKSHKGRTIEVEDGDKERTYHIPVATH